MEYVVSDLDGWLVILYTNYIWTACEIDFHNS